MVQEQIFIYFALVHEVLNDLHAFLLRDLIDVLNELNDTFKIEYLEYTRSVFLYALYQYALHVTIIVAVHYHLRLFMRRERFLIDCSSEHLLNVIFQFPVHLILQ